MMKTTNSRTIALVITLIAVTFYGCDNSVLTEAEVPDSVRSASSSQVTSSSELYVFQPAGEYGGGVLVPGTEFPPTSGSLSTLTRRSDAIDYTIETTGLPPGAYTNWIATINKPENCATNPCSNIDVFFNTEAVDASVFWTTGRVVQNNGVGRFRATINKGEVPDGPDQILWPGSGLQNPLGAEIHLVVKYHGPASKDPAVLHNQLYTLTGSCDVGANASDLGEPFGIQCFDPQFTIHQP